MRRPEDPSTFNEDWHAKSLKRRELESRPIAPNFHSVKRLIKGFKSSAVLQTVGDRTDVLLAVPVEQRQLFMALKAIILNTKNAKTYDHLSQEQVETMADILQSIVIPAATAYRDLACAATIESSLDARRKARLMKYLQSSKIHHFSEENDLLLALAEYEAAHPSQM